MERYFIVNLNLKATFQTGKLIFLCVIITSPSYFKVDKQIDACIGWIASVKIQKKRPGNSLATENSPITWKRCCTLAVAGFFMKIPFFLSAEVVAGLEAFLWTDCSPT